MPCCILQGASQGRSRGNRVCRLDGESHISGLGSGGMLPLEDLRRERKNAMFPGTQLMLAKSGLWKDFPTAPEGELKEAEGIGEIGATVSIPHSV